VSRHARRCTIAHVAVKSSAYRGRFRQASFARGFNTNCFSMTIPRGPDRHFDGRTVAPIASRHLRCGRPERTRVHYSVVAKTHRPPARRQ
jgi:hypothetical protein